MFTSSKSKEPLLYDVRIKGTDHDVILLKGSPAEAPSVLLSGAVVLSVQEPIQIKNLSLRLYGRLRLDILTPYQSSKGPVQRYVKYEKRVYEHVWDNFNIETYFQNLYDNYGRTAITSKSSTNLSSLPKLAKSSTVSLMSLTGQSSSHYHTLVKGNYEFPFSAILPGSLTESVEGLPNASVVYKLEATIERLKFYTDLVCRKHLRVVRTLSPAALELSETVAIDNTWPGKVDYSISIPAKAIAIGSATPISIMVVPLLKGLKLGPIKILLVENSQYCGAVGPLNSQERNIAKIRLKDPLNHMNDANGESSSENRIDAEYQDRWEVNTLLNVPPSLSKSTQDCTILNSIKVRHKIKFVISLVNPDGHVSELRASLPVQLFISPFVPLGIKTSDGLYSSANNSSSALNNLDHKTNPKEDESDDEVIFSGNAVSETDFPLNNQNNASIAASMSDLMSPPNYGRHKYDRLWSDVSNTNTPPLSGTHTPNENFTDNLNNNSGDVLDNQENIDELQQNLQKLHVEREHGRQDMPHMMSPGTDLERSPDTPDIMITQESATPDLRTVQSFSMAPGFSHISRQNSFIQPPSSSPVKKDWEIGTLSRVPSYDKAMKADMIGDDLPPAYPVSSEDDNEDVLERPQIVHHRNSSSYLATSSGTQMSHAALTRSNNSSSSSLSKSQNNSSTSLSNNQFPPNKNQTANRYFSFGMTPVGNNDSTTSLHLQRVSSKGHLHKSSGSFSNLMGLLSKKEKNNKS